jgi:membrane protease YdiL (CAAX protease family)
MPFDFDLSLDGQPPQPPSEPEPLVPLTRLPIAWVLLVALFASLISVAIMGGKSPDKGKKPESKLSQVEKLVKLKLGLTSLASNNTQKAYEDELDMLVNDAKTDPKVQRLRSVLRVEDSSEPFGDDIKNLSKSKDPGDKAFAELVVAKKPDKEKAPELLKQVGTKSLADKLLKVQIEERLGNSGIRAATFPPSASIPMLFLGCLLCVGVVAGFVIWGIYMNRYIAGAWRPLGHVFTGIDAGRADRLVLAATIVMGSYLVGNLLAAVIYEKTKLPQLTFIPFLAIGLAIYFIFRFPVAGYQIKPADMGLKMQGIGQEISWGFGAALANIPVLILASMIAMGLKSALPGGGHPVSEDILRAKGFMDILPIFILAAVVAPIWEEIVFRGLIFPSIAKFVGPFGGALLSSLMFAAIHPQGAIGVIPLGAIAMMLCGLNYQRRSIIGSMVMHALNNGGALILMLLVGSTMP